MTFRAKSYFVFALIVVVCALPAAAQDYLKFASDYLGVPISMVSTGPARHETIHI